MIVQDLANAGIEFSSKDMRISVWLPQWCQSSRLRQLPQEYSFTSRLVKLITEPPVHWKQIKETVGTDYVEFSPGDIFRIQMH